MSKLTDRYRKDLAVRSTREPLPSYSGSNNLFGTIARNTVPIATKVDFIPEDNDGNIIDLTGNISVAPQWTSLATKNMQLWAYVFCSPLAAVIDRLAEAYTNGRIELRDEDDATIKRASWIKSPQQKRVMQLIKKPNPLQTWQEFMSQQKVLCKIFGYCPVLCVFPSGFDKTFTKYMFNLNPFFCQPDGILNIDQFDYTNPVSPITTWSFNLFGRSFGSIPNDNILLVKDGFIDAINPGLGLPLSKVAGLDYAVSNICAAMEADNVLLKKKGPLGVFSHDPKPDMAGWQPLSPNQKDELQKDLAKYGLSWTQLQYVISKQPLKWNAMSFNLRDLMTKETARQGIDMICDRFGYPAELMSGKNATYENRNSAEKFMYQNNVIPFSLRTMDRYNEFFGFEDVRLVMDYNHLPVLQEDIVHSGQAYKANVEALQVEWTAGQITWNQWQIAQNRDTVTGMDIYYVEWAKINKIDINGTTPKNTSVQK